MKTEDSHLLRVIDLAGTIPLVLVPHSRWISLFIQVPTGMSVIVHRFGKHDGEWTPGLHFAPPSCRVACSRRSRTQR